MPTETSNPSRYSEGVWIAYRISDYRKPITISVHSDELEARRSAMGHYDPEADVLHVDWDETIESAYASMETTDA